MNTYSTELCHHGILGMKWGKKNGPPYPLGAGDHSASEKKAGWRKSLDSMSNEELRQKINRKNLENQYQQYSSRLGESRKTNNTISNIKKGLRTAGQVANVTSQGISLKNPQSKAKVVSDITRNTANAAANNLNKTKRVNLDNTDLSKMSDDELRKKVNRMMLETQYMDAYQIDTGKNKVDKFLNTAGTVASIAGTAVSIGMLLKGAGVKMPKRGFKIYRPKMG